MYEVDEYMAVYQKVKTHKFDTLEEAIKKKLNIETDKTRIGILKDLSE